MRIQPVQEEEAQGTVKAVYDALKSGFGIVPNVFKVLSPWPEALAGYASLIDTLMVQDSTLTRAQKEMIAAVVSKINHCDYCVGHHHNGMKAHGLAPQTADEVVADTASASIRDAEKKLLAFAGKTTRHAHKVTDADVDGLKEAGWTEQQILEATLVASLFCNVNRFADALGVQPE